MCSVRLLPFLPSLPCASSIRTFLPPHPHNPSFTPPHSLILTFSQVKEALALSGASSNTPKEAWCAAHLNMLCSSALRAYEQYGTFNDTTQRGFLVNYESLPGSVARVLLPSFGVEPSEFWYVCCCFYFYFYFIFVLFCLFVCGARSIILNEK